MGDGNESGDGNKRLLPQAARSYGLFIDNIHTSFENCNAIWEKGLEGDAVLKRYLCDIDDCGEYGIPVAVVHLTDGDAPPPPGQLGLARLSRLAEPAEKRGVDIALENLRKPEYLEYVYTNIDSNRLKFCYDCGHEHCRTKGADLLVKYADRVCALHLHDNDGADDQHRIPGEGTVDWQRVRTQLEASGYQGNVTFEVTNQFSPMYKDYPAKDFLAAAYQKAVEIFSK